MDPACKREIQKSLDDIHQTLVESLTRDNHNEYANFIKENILLFNLEEICDAIYGDKDCYVFYFHNTLKKYTIDNIILHIGNYLVNISVNETTYIDIYPNIPSSYYTGEGILPEFFLGIKELNNAKSPEDYIQYIYEQDGIVIPIEENPPPLEEDKYIAEHDLVHVNMEDNKCIIYKLHKYHVVYEVIGNKKCPF